MSLNTPDPGTRQTADPQAGGFVRVALYQRWPTSLENDRLRSYVASQPGWRIKLCSSDYASGRTLQRPGLQRVLKAARSGAIDVLVISHVNSLSRTPQHLVFLFNELMSRGVRVVSATDSGFDTDTAYGVFLMRMLSAVAEIEHEGVLEDRRVRRRQKRQSAHASPLAG